MKKYILVLIVYLNCESLLSQVDAFLYFPIKEGNVWVYQISTSSSQQWKVKKSVGNSVIANGHKYYNYDTYLIRVDSNTANVFQLYQGNGCQWSVNERMSDSLASRLNDSAKRNCGADNIKCIDTNIRVKFGISMRSKHFTYSNSNILGCVYTKGFGPISAYGGSSPYFWGQELLGCVLDGILYGDTSMMVGISQISEEIPETYSLFQNYPNPFNPTTKIRFSIPISKVVSEGQGVLSRLIIYDALGREVQTLVNENLSPGTYEVDFNGSDLPSGVYYYKLEVLDPSTPLRVTETKKMVLIK